VGSDWVSELVAHELAHLVFDDVARGPYGYPPRWLNEGVAVHLSRGFDEGDRAQVAAAARSGSIIPLDGLAGQFPTRPGRFRLAYAESISAVHHLVEQHGDAAVRELVAALAGGATLDAAFEAATGGDFRAFEDDWLASIGAVRPEPYGPPPGSSDGLPAARVPNGSALLR
jgi:flagellin